jgi:hypothetical protein
MPSRIFKTRSSALLVALIATVLAAPLSGGAFTYSLSGTWTANQEITPYFAPGAAFSLSFQVSNPPVVSGSTSISSPTSYSNGQYTLSGAPVALTGSELFFYDTASGQSFDFCLDFNCVYQITGGFTPFFTGPTSAPLLITGSLKVDQLNSVYFPPGKGIPDSFNIGPTTIYVSTPGGSSAPVSGVPEPASLALFGTGLTALYLGRKAVSPDLRSPGHRCRI